MSERDRGPHYAAPVRIAPGLARCETCGSAVKPVVGHDGMQAWVHTTFYQLARKGGSW